MADDERDFYQSLPILGDFAAAVRVENYRPLPDDWSVGLSDIVGSTKAIAEGRYKAVNMIGAGVIAAVSNALGGRAFPFVFGGDGASFAVGPQHALAAAKALDGHGGLLARGIRHGSQGRDDRGRRHPGRRPRRPRRPLRGLAPCGLCDVRRRRAFLVRGARQARRLRAAGRPRRAPGSVGPLLSLDRFAG